MTLMTMGCCTTVTLTIYYPSTVSPYTYHILVDFDAVEQVATNKPGPCEFETYVISP